MIYEHVTPPRSFSSLPDGAHKDAIQQVLHLRYVVAGGCRSQSRFSQAVIEAADIHDLNPSLNGDLHSWCLPQSLSRILYTMWVYLVRVVRDDPPRLAAVLPALRALVRDPLSSPLFASIPMAIRAELLQGVQDWHRDLGRPINDVIFERYGALNTYVHADEVISDRVANIPVRFSVRARFPTGLVLSSFNQIQDAIAWYNAVFDAHVDFESVSGPSFIRFVHNGRFRFNGLPELGIDPLRQDIVGLARGGIPIYGTQLAIARYYPLNLIALAHYLGVADVCEFCATNQNRLAFEGPHDDMVGHDEVSFSTEYYSIDNDALCLYVLNIGDINVLREIIGAAGGNHIAHIRRCPNNFQFGRDVFKLEAHTFGRSPVGFDMPAGFPLTLSAMQSYDHAGVRHAFSHSFRVRQASDVQPIFCYEARAPLGDDELVSLVEAEHGLVVRQNGDYLRFSHAHTTLSTSYGNTELGACMDTCNAHGVPFDVRIGVISDSSYQSASVRIPQLFSVSQSPVPCHCGANMTRTVFYGNADNVGFFVRRQNDVICCSPWIAPNIAIPHMMLTLDALKTGTNISENAGFIGATVRAGMIRVEADSALWCGEFPDSGQTGMTDHTSLIRDAHFEREQIEIKRAAMILQGHEGQPTVGYRQNLIPSGLVNELANYCVFVTLGSSLDRYNPLPELRRRSPQVQQIHLEPLTWRAFSHTIDGNAMLCSALATDLLDNDEAFQIVYHEIRVGIHTDVIWHEIQPSNAHDNNIMQI